MDEKIFQILIDITGILGFILSIILVFHKLFIEGKPKLKLSMNYATTYGSQGIKYVNYYRTDVIYFVFTFLNIGNGPINLRSCGFRLKNDNKLQLINRRFLTNPVNGYFPYILAERKKLEIFYPCEEYYKITISDRKLITHIFTVDETEREWKIRIKLFNKSDIKKKK